MVFGCACGAASTTSLRSKDNENTQACTPRHQNLAPKLKGASQKHQNECKRCPSEPQDAQKTPKLIPRPPEGSQKKPKRVQEEPIGPGRAPQGVPKRSPDQAPKWLKCVRGLENRGFRKWSFSKRGLQTRPLSNPLQDSPSFCKPLQTPPSHSKPVLGTNIASTPEDPQGRSSDIDGPSRRPLDV